MTDKGAEHAVKAAVAAATAVVELAKRLGLIWTIRPATVFDGVDPTAVSAVYDGDTATIKMTSVIGAQLSGARVYAIVVPPAGNFIIGMCGQDLVALPNSGSVNGPSAAGTTTTSATFVDVGGIATLTFTKISSTSRLKLEMHPELFPNTAGNTEAEFALQIDNVDYPVLTVFMNTVGIVEGGSGVLHVAGIAAGTYSIKARWRRVSGAGTLQTGSAEHFSFSVEETT